MQGDSVAAEYQRKLQEAQTGIGRAARANTMSLRALIVALALCGWLLIAGAQKQAPMWSFALTLPLAVGAGIWHGKNRD